MSYTFICTMGTTTGRVMTAVFFIYFVLMSNLAKAFLETPKFSQLRLLYPGYPDYGGHYHQQKLMRFILGEKTVDEASDHRTSAVLTEKNVHLSSTADNTLHHSAAVRLSYTLNRYGGRHAIGTLPVQLTHHTSSPFDSFTGIDGQQYIFRNEAFGPFLAERYGNPEVVWTATGDFDDANNRKSSLPMSAFRGRQGIVRIVSFRRHTENGHVALWDCNRFHQSRDWSTESHVISVEFWESADSHCPPTTFGLDSVPPPLQPPSSSPSLATLDDPSVQVIPRHNFKKPPYLRDSDADDDNRRQRIVDVQSSSLGGSPMSIRGRRRRDRHGTSLWLQ